MEGYHFDLNWRFLWQPLPFKCHLCQIVQHAGAYSQQFCFESLVVALCCILA